MSGVDDKLVSQRLTTLIHRFLDAELLKSALFYAERLFSMDGTNHDSRHLLSNVLLKSDQPHSALHLVTRPQDEPCAGCLFLAAKCNERLLRPRKAKEKMTEALEVMTGIPEGSKPRPAQSMHLAHDIPDIAIVYCKAGMLAAKASQRQEAIDNFSHALALEPLIWDAWLGLCTLGADIKIDEVLKIPPHLQNVPATLPSDNEPTPPRPLTSNPILSRISKQYAIAPTPLTKPEAVGSSRGLFTPEQSGVDQLPYRYHLGNLPKPDTTICPVFRKHHWELFQSSTNQHLYRNLEFRSLNLVCPSIPVVSLPERGEGQRQSMKALINASAQLLVARTKGRRRRRPRIWLPSRRPEEVQGF